MNLSVVIPVYNEVNHIAEILKRVQATQLPTEIIVVDDGSQDGTRAILQQLDGNEKVRVILHERNQGKGAAVESVLFCLCAQLLPITPRENGTQPFFQGALDDELTCVSVGTIDEEIFHIIFSALNAM